MFIFWFYASEVLDELRRRMDKVKRQYALRQVPSNGLSSTLR